MLALRRWLFSRSLQDLRGVSGVCIRLLRVVWFAAHEFRRDFCFERAATLSFATIISLIPLAVLLLGAAVQFGKGDEFIAYLKERIFPSLAPEFQTELSRWLEQNISRRAFEQLSVGIVGLVALAGLIVAAMGGINAAERIFNRLWKVQGSRTYLQKAVTFWAILTLSPFLMVASLWVQNLLVPEGGFIDQLTQGSMLLQGLYRFLVPLTLGFLGLTVLYRYLPATLVRFRSATFGAFLAAILWKASEGGFRVYVARSSSVASLYGPLSIVPLFFVWVYLNWLIVLLGCELVYAHQNLSLLSELMEHSVRGRRLSERYIALHLLERLGRAYHQGERLPDASEISGELLILRSEVIEVASRLADSGILLQDGRRQGSYGLACDPSKIYLDRVIRQFPSSELEVESARHKGGGAEPNCRSLFEAGHARFIEVFKDKTVQDLLTPPSV